MPPQDRIRKLLEVSSLEGYRPESALTYLAQLINLAMDVKSIPAAEHAVKLGKPLTAKSLPRTYRAQIHYFLSNAWAAIYDAKRQTNQEKWAWRQEELDQQIIHLRQARGDSGFATVHPEQRAQILTNLANAFNKIGRTVEAVEFYDEALKASSGFGMTLGNKGIALSDYAISHYDSGHQRVMLSYSHQHLSDCLKGPLEDGAHAHFLKRRDWIATKVPEPEKHIEHSQRAHSLGRSKAEKAYRKWALRNRLFLNPLNDLGPLEIACHDSLMLPDLTTPIGTGPKYHGLFNQLKQEYVSARFFLYDSLGSNGTHFSDRDTQLLDTLDYPAYGIAVEKAKLSLRMSYSLLDKIAFFLNDYLALSIPQNQVNFTSIWHVKGRKEKGLNPLFDNRANWPLRGLYWLSRDGFDDAVSPEDAIEPDAREIKDLRHALEHRYVKVHLEGVPVRGSGDMFFDELAHGLTRSRLEELALRALKDSRAAIVYLSLAVNSHERQKNRTAAPGKAMPITLDKFEDRFKN